MLTVLLCHCERAGYDLLFVRRISGYNESLGGTDWFQLSEYSTNKHAASTR